jgi:protein SCO1/2
MRGIQAALPPAERDRVRFVLLSFDPTHDTSAVLNAYRGQSGLPSASWVLARAAPETVRELAMVLGFAYAESADGQFVHSSLITVLDRNGEIAHQQTDLRDGPDAAVRALVAADSPVGRPGT